MSEEKNDVMRKRVVYEIAGMDAVSVERDVSYGGTAGLTMDLYHPAGLPGRRPAVIFVAGFPDPGFQAVIAPIRPRVNSRCLRQRLRRLCQGLLLRQQRGSGLMPAGDGRERGGRCLQRCDLDVLQCARPSAVRERPVSVCR